MRLYIEDCIYCHQRIYLNVTASTRVELANRIGYYFEVECPFCHHHQSYSVDRVFAESGQSNVPGVAILGGLIGLIAGPEGALLGGLIGSAIGAKADNEDRGRVQHFNSGASTWALDMMF